MIRIVAVIGLTIALGACASSGSVDRQARSSAAASTTATAKTGPGDERICKSTPITGSRAMKRVCHTRDEWAAMRTNAEETVRTTQQRPTGHFDNTGGGNGG